jgi:hypothetical protein
MIVVMFMIIEKRGSFEYLHHCRPCSDNQEKTKIHLLYS